jgi:phage-related holin
MIKQKMKTDYDSKTFRAKKERKLKHKKLYIRIIKLIIKSFVIILCDNFLPSSSVFVLCYKFCYFRYFQLLNSIFYFSPKRDTLHRISPNIDGDISCIGG